MFYGLKWITHMTKKSGQYINHSWAIFLVGWSSIFASGCFRETQNWLTIQNLPPKNDHLTIQVITPKTTIFLQVSSTFHQVSSIFQSRPGGRERAARRGARAPGEREPAERAEPGATDWPGTAATGTFGEFHGGPKTGLRLAKFFWGRGNFWQWWFFFGVVVDFWLV